MTANLLSTLAVALPLLSPILLGMAGSPAHAQATFANPVLERGADPHAILHEGEYFYIASNTNQLTLWRTRDITDLRNAQKKVIWTPPPGTDHSKNVWAPEIHFLRGKWYVYVAADDGNGDNHKMFVLENDSPDPFAGEFKLKSRIKTDPNDNWAIDGSVFEHKGELYMVWSGWPIRRVTTETACIYIARMSDPWTIGSERVMLSQPALDWERHNRNPPEWKNTPGHEIFVNEGPAVLSRGERLFITYSASGCWTPFYSLGLLSHNGTGDLLDPNAWTKLPKPVFVQQPDDQVFGPGHNSFFKSPDGKEDWIFYHANDKPNECGGPMRSPRMQRVEWSADGKPIFGKPVAAGVQLAKPSGTKR